MDLSPIITDIKKRTTSQKNRSSLYANVKEQHPDLKLYQYNEIIRSLLSDGTLSELSTGAIIRTDAIPTLQRIGRQIKVIEQFKTPEEIEAQQTKLIINELTLIRPDLKDSYHIQTLAKAIWMLRTAGAFVNTTTVPKGNKLPGYLLTIRL